MSNKINLGWLPDDPYAKIKRLEAALAKAEEALQIVVSGYLSEPGSDFNWCDWYCKASLALEEIQKLKEGR